MDRKGFYAILKIPESAGEKEIKAAFREQVKLFHPDKNSSSEATEIYLKLNEAYHVLTDAEAKRAYDNTSSDGADFIPCHSCGRHSSQPRYILFQEGDVFTSGVFCRPCASKQQFRSALKNWRSIFTHPIGSWQSLKNNFAVGEKPPARNVEILLQNAAAFRHENRIDLARSLAEQARRLTDDPALRQRAGAFLDALPDTKRRKENDFWKVRWMDALRVYLPVIILAVIFSVSFSAPYIRDTLFVKKVNFVDYRPINLTPVAFDVFNEELLYHTTQLNTPGYQAPCLDCGIIELLPEQTTVRVTGLLPNTDWIQVMTPLGKILFLRKHLLTKGIGKHPLPYNSKITPPK